MRHVACSVRAKQPSSKQRRGERSGGTLQTNGRLSHLFRTAHQKPATSILVGEFRARARICRPRSRSRPSTSIHRRRRCCWMSLVVRLRLHLCARARAQPVADRRPVSQDECFRASREQREARGSRRASAESALPLFHLMTNDSPLFFGPPLLLHLYPRRFGRSRRFRRPSVFQRGEI